MENSKVSDIVITLSSLYELLLNIGQSFDIQENAETFLKTLMFQKNLSLAAYYTLDIDTQIKKVHSIPKTEIDLIEFDAQLLELKDLNRFKVLKKSDLGFDSISKLSNLQLSEFAIYFVGSKGLLVMGKKNDSFNHLDLVKSELVLDKFGLFMESLESHHQIKDEIKIKEEQAKIIKENNEKLLKQNEELKKYIRSNNELEKFAYQVSHDLNSPLNTIIGFSNLFVQSTGESLSEEQEMFLKYILDAGTQMKNLIIGILDYSKINGDALNLNKVDVNQMLEKTNNLLSQNLKDVDGKMIVKDLPEYIIADETKIKQLFLNLISNALKFRKADVSPEVIINGELKGDEFLFSIADNGIGIPEESKDKIFDVFNKASNNRKFEGHGIGLSICKQIINQHQGEIWIESEPNKGTTFYFTLQNLELN